MGEKSNTGKFVAGIRGFLRLAGKSVEEPQVERRSHERILMRFDAEIEGPTGSLRAKGLNLDRQGLGVVCDQPLAPGSLVFAHVKCKRLLGFAHVRNCRPRGSSFAIGLEFRGEPMQQEIGTWVYQHIASEN